ncbi:MAG: outer membrane protein assembly factor BamA [Rickettsiales bacterium]|nr:outer membrane protein assembly factor BamA [Rickettsiales bacterium]
MALAFAALPLASSAEVVKSIEVEGNRRIDSEMIRNLLPLKVGAEFDGKSLNTAVHSLYGSGFFSDVAISGDKGAVSVSVTENPSIGAVAFEGNDAIKDDDFAKSVSTRSRGIFSEAALRRDVEAIKALYKQLGFFKARIDAKVIERDSGRRDVVFEIAEGTKGYIFHVGFEGNDSFSDAALREVVSSKEYSWWKFLEMADVYHMERIVYDASLLDQFYRSQGFLDYETVSYGAKMNDAEDGFYVDFAMKEGPRYKVGALSVRSEIPDLDASKLEGDMLLRTGRWYDDGLANRTVSQMVEKLGAEGFAFVDVKVERVPDRAAGTVDVAFVVKDSSRTFVSRIDVKNNTRTHEGIIRRNLAFAEQDIFNSDSLARSKQKLMALGYFGNVGIQPKAVQGVPDKVGVDVVVEEQSTGELSLSAGWSSVNKSFVEFGIKESNFMGKGQTLGFNSTFSALQNVFNLTFTEPYMWDRDLMGGADVFFSRSKSENTLGYNVDTVGTTLRLGWSYNDNLFHRVRFSVQNDRYVDISDKLPSEMRVGMGDSNIYRVGQTLTYQDQVVDYVNDTRTGYSVSLSNEYAGFGGDRSFLRNSLALRQYFSFWDGEWQFMAAADAGAIKALAGTTLSQSYKYTLGADSLRGFEYRGVAGRNICLSAGCYQYPFGGLWEVNGTFQLNFPIFIPRRYKISGYVFYDWGKVGPPEIDSANLLYSARMRTSVGYGISWNSPMGTINFSWGRALTYEDYDERQRFLFSIGSSF